MRHEELLRMYMNIITVVFYCTVKGRLFILVVFDYANNEVKFKICKKTMQLNLFFTLKII